MWPEPSPSVSLCIYKPGMTLYLMLYTDVAPNHGLAGFVLVMAASLAVYLQLVASLSEHWKYYKEIVVKFVCVGHRQEFGADKTAAQCSSGYAQGGLDHFAKRMKLDSALQ